MPKEKYNCERLKCALPFDEALRRAMLVKPPKDWKKVHPRQPQSAPLIQ